MTRPARYVSLPRPVSALAFLGIGLILTLSLGAILAVWLRSDASSALSPADWAAVKFTLKQAALSALLSVVLAIPVARALSRRQFRGRSVIVALLGAPFILPVIVAILGLLAVFGRSGIVNSVLGLLGVEPFSIFGLQGVLLAHVFFNMPLATRLFLQGWQQIPAERFRLAASLQFSGADHFRHIELPMLRMLVPRTFVLIFLICLTSFAVALTLGGGPKATTIELAIYQAFSFDFDLARASKLALIQVGIGAVTALGALMFTLPDAIGSGMDRRVHRWDGRNQSAALWDGLAIVLAVLFITLPLSLIILQGLPHIGSLEWSIYLAATNSILVSGGSVLIMLLVAVPVALWSGRSRFNFGEGAGLLMLSVSPLVLGTGLFLIVFPFIDPSTAALPVTALVNAMAALPFALRAIVPAVSKAETDFGRLAVSLSMSSWNRLRLVTFRRAKGPIAFSSALTAALSMGDLGVITLFSGADNPTLPLMIYRLMGAYRADAAAAAAVILLLLSFGAFFVIDKAGRRDA